MEAKDGAAMQAAGWDMTTPGNLVKGMRAWFDIVLGEKEGPLSPEEAKLKAIYQKYQEKCTQDHRIDVGGPEYHPNAAVIEAYVIKQKGKLVNNRCLIFFHGGAAIAGTAPQFNFYCNRMAVDYDATVINVDYRRAPEHKSPCGIDDGYAAVKWAIAKANELGINPNKIATIGESGGGYIVAGISMRLAEANEGGLIRFSAHVSPMCTNKLLITPESALDPMGLMIKGVVVEIIQALCENYEELEANNFTDKWIFPTLLDDELCKKCPPAVVLTTEYDTCNTDAKEIAEVYRRNDNLIAFGSVAGSTHCYHYNPLHCRSKAWHKAVGKICRKYI